MSTDGSVKGEHSWPAEVTAMCKTDSVEDDGLEKYMHHGSSGGR